MSTVDPNSAAGANGSEAANKPQWQAIDPTALGRGLFSEKVVIDPKGDAFAITPPIPDGKYVVVLGPSTDPETPTLQGINYPARVGKNGEALPALNAIRINAELTVEAFLDPAADNSILVGKPKTFDKSFSTLTKKKEGLPTSEAVTLLNYVGIDVPSGTDAEVIAGTLYQVLASKQARVGIEGCWKAGFHKDDNNPKDFGKFDFVGMRSFPVMANGQPSPVVSYNGKEYRAKFYITRVFPLGR